MSSPPIVNERDERLAALLSQCALRNRSAFKELYEETKTKLFAVSLRIVRERHLAEEVLQDSFVKIWNHAASYATQKAAPMTWMAAIVRNRSLDLTRRPKLEVADEDGLYTLGFEDEAPGPDAHLALSRDQARVERCLQTLDADQKQSIALAFYHGLSHSEVAEHLKRPLGTVKTHIRRGLAKLKGCLET
jgi:RNA polymerase sigma-70 factor (ECF subfamily)